uniref:Denticleless E3 ubiquitin protein ligase homolog (Drosophila) n=1 Tax=Hippocampus comes TaxID=109280 RepID=A0A3Q2XID5_HIPCM
GMFFRSIVDNRLGRLRSLLEGYQCVRLDEHISYGNLGDSVPPFGLSFSSAKAIQDVLAVANEEGIVRIYNTEGRGNGLVKEWLAHENAVFDIAWVPGESQLVTAAGDQMARLWDVKSGELLGSFKGHLCSLKSVAFTSDDKAVFCTGGRDGNILVWDTRCSKKGTIYDSARAAWAPDTLQSVTVVLFQDQHTLISSGAVDGFIKMWDLRKNYTAHHHEPVALQTYPYPGSSMRVRLGYSGLVLDSTRSNVMCNCTDDNIYMFNVSGIKTTPEAVFNGHQNSSFYIKSTICPNDQFLASGSSDNHTYIWKISDPTHPPMTLQGHSQEVTSVAWCPTDFTKLASCSDDHTVRIWRLHREMDGAPSSVGEANLVGWARPKKLSNRPETTPAKDQRAESIGGPASPRLAACAPSMAALPLSSCTASPVPSQQAKATNYQKTPRSIKSWLSPRQGSPSQKSPLQCKVLSSCSQSSVGSTSTMAPRAKRRLETANGSSDECEGAKPFDCVSELSPVSKKSRAQSGISRPTQKGLLQTDNHIEEGRASSRQIGKENYCPGMTDWLSVMSQKMRGSPRSPRSPAAAKKQAGKMPASPVSTISNTLSSLQNMKKISSYFTRRLTE